MPIKEPVHDTGRYTETKQRPFQIFREDLSDLSQKHIDADPQAPENVQMVNMISIGECILDIRRKLTHLDKALGMNPSLLADIVFKVYHTWETGNLK